MRIDERWVPVVSKFEIQRIHKALRITPAMVAGISDHV
jgi:hypothetical protein